MALFVTALAVLLGSPGTLPEYTYNWEHYTADDLYRFADGDRPLRESFYLTDGLMTDSGESPFLTIPTLAVWNVVGSGLTSMRLVAVLISALAVPLLWLLARRLFDPWVATAGAGLLVLSPGFLLYARSATIVGLSIGIGIATAYALLRVLQPDAAGRPRLVWLSGFLALLVVGSYGYSPIRFFWPIAVGAIVIELIFQPRARHWLLPAGVLIAVFMPLVLTLSQAQGWTIRPATLDVSGAVIGHYQARGEQLLTLTDDPNSFESYVEVSEEERETASTTELAIKLVRKNIRDLTALVLDNGTRPVLTDHWNINGRLYAGLLVPGVLLGLVVLGFQAVRRLEARFALELVLGFSVPMVLTSKVHVGRLVFALPFFLVIGAFGYVWLARRVALAAERRSPGAARALASSAAGERGHAGVAFVSGDRSQSATEALDVAAYRLWLDDQFQFINLALGEQADPVDRRTPLYYGGLITDLEENDDGLPSPCDLSYVIRDRARQAFDERATALETCPRPPDVVRVP